MAELTPSLNEVAAERGTPQRNCKSCAHFEPGEDDLAFGWCRAHDQFVKLYHGQFWSQCQFKYLARGLETPGPSEA